MWMLLYVCVGTFPVGCFQLRSGVLQDSMSWEKVWITQLLQAQARLMHANAAAGETALMIGGSYIAANFWEGHSRLGSNLDAYN